jgi:eukaryotic-like serine/threonine-protein kinase
VSSTAADGGAQRRWQRLEELFGEGSELAPAERAAWLDALAPADRTLEAELRSLLQAHDRGGDFLAEAVAQAEQSLSATGNGFDVALDGLRVGAYRLLRLLGRGGMGTVYLAERADEAFRQQVAIKLVPWALATPEARHRFQAERQTLAGLEHPHIARLVDGGETADGLPYLVMEFVDGEPIDAYCGRHGLDVEQRLRLFREVCAAVAHAHRNLVVHRDLKPANILVTASGEVKLLDFGIAKLLPGAQLDAAFPLTRAGRLMMTPLFASPEQLRGEPITTATDIYALGLLLFRLLTGQHPYRLANTTPVEVARAVCERPPTRPSSAVGIAAAGAAALAGGPGGLGGAGNAASSAGQPTLAGIPGNLTPAALRRRLRGDLDNIVLMALRKEPDRRYASVDQLSEDVRRHLDQLPVRARADTMIYRSTKFARRHRAALLAAALLAAALVGGLLSTLRQAHIAERRFQETRALANALLFDVHDAIAPLPGSTPARQLLVRDGLAYLDRLAAEAGDDMGLELELAAAYRRLGDVQGNPSQPNLGDIAGAAAAYGKAQQILGRLLRRTPASAAVRGELARSDMHAADTLASAGRIGEAVQLYRGALTLETALAAESPADAAGQMELARCDIAYGNLQAWNSDLAGGLASFASARRILERLHAAPAAGAAATRPRPPAPAAATPTAKAAAAADASPGDAAKAAGERRNRRPPTRLEIERELASTWTRTGDALCWEDHCKEAAAWHRRAIGALEALARQQPNDTATRQALLTAYLKMAEAMEGTGDTLRRIAACERTLVVARQMTAADPRDTMARRYLAIGEDKLGDALVVQHRFATAQEHYRSAMDILAALVALDTANLQYHRDLANTYNRIGEALIAAGRPGDAVGSLMEGLRVREWLVVHDPQDLFSRRDPAVSYGNLGDVHLGLAQGAAGSPAERRAHLSAARGLYVHALDLWADLAARGAVKPADQGEIERVRRAVRTCDEASRRAG